MKNAECAFLTTATGKQSARLMHTFFVVKQGCDISSHNFKEI
jgi:hypothetical protein